MKKTLIIVLAILGMAWGASAQNLGADRLSASGSHVGSGGCKLCHTPHAVGANNASSSASYSASTPNYYKNFGADWGVGGAPAASTVTKVNMANNGLNTGNANQVYLWAVTQTPQTYTTYNGDTINSATNWKTGDAAVHTLVCLTCHDNATGSHEMTAYSGPAGSWTNTNGFQNAIDIGQGEAMGNSVYNCNWNGSTCAAAWSPNSSLQTSHPVHVKYSGSSLWQIDANGYFTDSSFGYGHPAKLWMQGGNAYVECTSCHDPHRRYYTSSWSPASNRYVVSASPNTDFYVRGPYSAPDEAVTTGGVQNANFCRSCHYSKTQEYITNLGAAK